MIKAIVFDYGQTLVDASAGFRMAEKQARETLATLLPVADGSFTQHYREVRSRFHAASNFSRVDMWQQALAQYNVPVDSGRLEAMEREYWHLVRRHTRLFPETLQVLRALSKRYRLAIISNTQGERTYDAEPDESRQAAESPENRHNSELSDSRQAAVRTKSLQATKTQSGHPTPSKTALASGHPAPSKALNAKTHRLFAHTDLSELFEYVIIAGENGLPAKPHPEPFLLCLRKMRLRPEEMLYIGDDWHKDLLGAGGCGIRALWLQHHSVPRNWPVDAASHNATVITTLEPLIDYAFLSDVHHIPIHHP